MRQDLASRGFKNLVVWTRGADRTIQPTVTRGTYRTRPRLLSVGRVSKEKGLDDLIQFQDNYDLIIVGDGPYRAELEQKLPKATFLGYLHGQELVDQYALADVFVFPSVTDTFGVVIIEALAQGCPVAAYPVAGPIDIIKKGVTGYLDNNLAQSVRNCLALNNNQIKKASQKWTWKECWRIFCKNLVAINTK
jgi:glycosyltransferase involved in cell wall biosynthesis